MTTAIRTFVLALSYCIGILLADAVQPPFHVPLLTGVFAVVSLLLAWLIHRGRADSSRLLPRLSWTVLVLFLLGAGGMGFANAGMRSAARQASLLLHFDGKAVSIEGSAASEQLGGNGVAHVLKLRRLDGRSQTGRVLVSSAEAALTLGDRVHGEVRLEAMDRSDSFESALYRRGVIMKAKGQLTRTGSSHNPVLRAANAFRARMRRGVVDSLGSPDAGLLLGLTIGDESRIPARVIEEFRAAGLSHLTAVSGANVAIVLGAVVVICRALRLRYRWQIAFGLATLGFFVLVTRWEPSVLRASVMAAIALCSFFFGRRSQALNALALALVALSIADPFILWSIAFQLSFAASMGIIVLGPMLRVKLARLPSVAADALSVAIAAQAAVAPLVAVHFGTFSPWAVPANMLAFGPVAPATLLGFIGGAAANVSPVIARPFVVSAGPLVWLIRKVAEAFSNLPGATLLVPHDPLTIGLICLLVLAVVLALDRRRQLARWPILAAAASLIFSNLAAVAKSDLPAGARITFLDVGQGDAALIESAGGARVLVDGGPDPHLLKTLLRREGVRRLDVVIASHGHFDHVNGLKGVLDGFDVRQALDPGVPVPLVEKVGTFSRAQDGESYVVGDLEIQILGPSSQLREQSELSLSEPEGAEINDASIVARISWKNQCALFPGDLEEEGQRVLAERHPSAIQCSVLKAPHHGSGRLLESFVRSVKPKWVVVSVGRNDYGHPSRKALRIFRDSGARVLRTDRSGNVEVEFEEGGGTKAVP